MIYRLAKQEDIPTLAEMRWEFKCEEGEPLQERGAFLAACALWLQEALQSEQWSIWVAIEKEQLVSHLFLYKVPKVPSPHDSSSGFGYVTNVYTKPGFRNAGIGTALMERLSAFAKQEGFELLIVWPSEPSESFYSRCGFKRGTGIFLKDL